MKYSEGSGNNKREEEGKREGEEEGVGWRRRDMIAPLT